jgi:hypothetical protein
MSTIIAGGFENVEYGNRALLRLSQAAVPTEYICTYGVNPPGMRDRTPVGASTASGHEDLRPAEMLVAVNADAAGVDEQSLVRIFEECGAWRVERAEGRWADGVWADFDPVARPRLIGGRDRFDTRPAGENGKRT